MNITAVVISQYPNDSNWRGDEAEVWLKNGAPYSAQTVYDINGFMSQLERDYPAPAGCEWIIIDTCHAQVVRRSKP
jgi:hypothetical protein